MKTNTARPRPERIKSLMALIRTDSLQLLSGVGSPGGKNDHQR